MRPVTGLICFPLALLGAGCAARLASTQFSEYAVPGHGASRQTVQAALGKPDMSLDDGQGRRTDIYRRVDMDDNTRWMSHTVLDILTLGLWELIGVPVEVIGRRNGWWRMTEYDIRLTYDPDGYVVGRDIRTETRGAATF